MLNLLRRSTGPTPAFHRALSSYITTPHASVHPSAYAPSLKKVSLDRLWRFGPTPLPPSKILESAELTRREVCELVQRRVNAHLSLPYLPASNPHIKEVMSIYRHAFDEISSLPPIQNFEHNSALLQALTTMVDDSADVIGMFATGFKESKRYLSDEQISSFLNRAIQSRISIRLLAEQHLSLSQSDKPSSPGRIGIVDKHIKLKKSLESVLEFVRQLSEGTYGFSPEWHFSGEVDAEICFVEMHIRFDRGLEKVGYDLRWKHVIATLTSSYQNFSAFRATVEHHQQVMKTTHSALAPIEITISVQRPSHTPLNPMRPTDSSLSEAEIVPSMLCIRIRDRGGGIDPKDLPHVFLYAFSTVGSARKTMGNMGYHADLDRILGGQESLKCSLGRIAGLGFGLPMAKLYCRYFGGNLELVNMHGMGGGVDSYITMTVGTL